jgi:hypothetical protein
LATYIAQKSYGARQSTLKRPAEQLTGKLLIEFGTTLAPCLLSVLSEMLSSRYLTGIYQKNDMVKNSISLEKPTAQSVKVR